jgi:2-polyprenyl-3-methyl-5-hydroxy-6-metoxy-1,4-benzoquinol methylase
MLKLIPKSAKRVLEVGCGTGDFSVSVKRKTGAECWAIEYQPDIAEKAARVLDRVLTGDIDTNIPELPEGYFDVIVANDVLEHLVHPWTTLELLRPKLAPGGVVVASIPNIRFLPALAQIVFRRDFPLDDQGVFDRTHLRWFTRKSIPRMFQAAGYEVQKLRGIHMAANPLVPIIGLASLGFLWDGVWMQYKVVAIPQTKTVGGRSWSGRRRRGRPTQFGRV